MHHLPSTAFWLGFSIAANLSVLFLFKYHDFFAASLNGLSGTEHFSLWHLLLPVGLSFHTFQAMAYTTDVYQDRQKAERHPGYYALFVMFYPQLVAGPIERSGQLIPQLKQQKPADFTDFGTGLKWMLWGYFLKVVVADRLGIYVDYVFLHPEVHGRLALAIAAFFYSFQIYGDFGGYSLIALGTARCMGISLTKNFRRPYLSSSLQKFWRRWNITLSAWFRDYLYFPLGGSRVGRIRFVFNIIVVFILSGIWHGANLTFVVWGGIHGMLLLITRIFKTRSMPRWFGIPFTFFLVSISWIFFRSRTVHGAVIFIHRLFAPSTEPLAGGEFDERVLLLYGFLATAVVMVSEVCAEFFPGRLQPLWDRRLWIRLSACVVLIVIILLFGVFDGSQFIYFQF